MFTCERCKKEFLTDDGMAQHFKDAHTTYTWVVTREVNDYNQHGDYFEHCFAVKPTFQDIKSVFPNMDDSTAGKLTRGGGREGVEYEWYNLCKVKNKN